MNRVRILWLCSLLVIGLAGQMSRPAHARQQATQVQEQRFTFVLLHTPLSDALKELINKTDIDILYESELIAGRVAFCNIEQASAREALACILKSAGLDFYQQSTGVYVITKPREDAPRFGSLTGLILDDTTGEPLPYASVFLEEAATGAATNIEGRFAISRLKPGTYRISASHIAYEATSDSLHISPASNRRLEIRMTPRTVMTTPIVINGFHQRLDAEALNTSLVNASALQNAPGASTPSTLQSLDAVAGVHVGDALADVHLQGGDSGEHQYLLDNAPVFVPIRNGGFFGPFSPFALEQITVHKAGFGASHGSYLSGSVELKHDLRSSDGTIATVQVDPLSVNGRINGSLRAGKEYAAQWMIAGRLGIWDVLRPKRIENSFREWSHPNTFLSQVLNQDNGEIPILETDFADSLLTLSFNDIHAATRIRLGATRSLYAAFYRGNNAFGIGTLPFNLADEDHEEEHVKTPGEHYRWYNQVSLVRYEWVHGDRTFFNIGTWQSTYLLTHPFAESPFLKFDPEPTEKEEELAEDFNEIKEIGVYTGMDWSPGARHVISARLAFVATAAEFKLNIDPFAEAISITNKVVAPQKWRLQTFVEDAISLSKQTRLVVGSRFTYIPLQQRLYAEPRAAVHHDFGKHAPGTWAIVFSAGLYRQFYNQFDVAPYNNTALLPGFRFWIPINRDTRASSAYHASGHLMYKPGENWLLNLESYFKYHPYLTVLDYTARLDQPALPADPNRFLQRAKGYAYGASISANHHREHMSLRASYEYAVSRRKLEGRFNDQFVPVPWESPHQLFALADFTPLNHLTLTVRWQGLYGRSWGYRRAYYDYLEPDPTLATATGTDLTRPQDHKLPAFTQWDLGIAYTKKIGRLALQGRFNVVNLFNETNVIDWVLARDADNNLQRRSRKTTPLFPSFSLKVTY